MNEDTAGSNAIMGLIVLGVMVVAADLVCSIPKTSIPESPNGNCLYQIFEDDECLGTFFFNDSATISNILAAAGTSPRGRCADSMIPCNRAILLTTGSQEVAVRRIKGQNLIALGKRVDINDADMEDLKAIPGIGSVLSERILKDREERGRYSTISEVKRVPGLGKGKISGMSPYVEVGKSP
jgi:competence ComEA-like helix-hairpin-helix protein